MSVTLVEIRETIIINHIHIVKIQIIIKALSMIKRHRSTRVTMSRGTDLQLQVVAMETIALK